MNNSHKKSRVAVIGGGPAGLFAGHLLHQAGFQVALFESHSKPGGCASFFRRKGEFGSASFDAGATVINELSPGHFLDRLLKHCDVKLTAPFKKNLCVFFHLDGGRKFLLQTQSFESFEKSLLQAFPADSAGLSAFFSRYRQPVQSLMRALVKVPHLPIQRWQDLKFNLKMLHEAKDILPLIFESRLSFSDVMNHYDFSPELRRWIEMNFLITLQCRSHDCYPIVGALAFYFYLLDSGALEGGMRSLFEPLLASLKERAQVFTRTRVTQTEKINDEFFLQLADGRSTGPYDLVVSSLPRFGTRKIFRGPSPFSTECDESQLVPQTWSALVAYLVVKDGKELPSPPFNTHAADGAHETYMSFSGRDATERCPAGYRVVTLSTHCRSSEWFPESGPLEEALYEKKKAARGRELLKQFQNTFPDTEVVFQEYGTPQTFHWYTQRSGGSVGGLPLSKKFSLWNSMPQRTYIDGLYQIGDTSFPGQSILACALGACAVVEKITGAKLSIK